MLYYNSRMSDTLHALSHTHQHHHSHGHGHSHAHGAAASHESGFSLLALSSPTRLALAVPVVGALWLLTLWALHG